MGQVEKKDAEYFLSLWYEEEIFGFKIHVTYSQDPLENANSHT